MTKSTEDHLPPYRVRPRFEVELNRDVADIVDSIKKAIAAEDNIKARFIEGHATLYLPAAEAHYWSPQLTLSINASEEGAVLRGIYGPRPAVWTMFVFFYSLIGFAILIIALFGFSNLSLGNSAKILWLIPVLVIIFLSLYLISFFGQRLGRDQMVTLHEFVERSIGQSI